MYMCHATVPMCTDMCYLGGCAESEGSGSHCISVCLAQYLILSYTGNRVIVACSLQQGCGEVSGWVGVVNLLISGWGSWIMAGSCVGYNETAQTQ